MNEQVIDGLLTGLLAAAVAWYFMAGHPLWAQFIVSYLVFRIVAVWWAGR